MKNPTTDPLAKRSSPLRATLKSHGSGGFALVVTLTLMVLLTVIALGLISLSTISIRTSSRSEAMTEAKANARLGLMLAIGELQKSVGPDQRITATATILGDSENAYTSGAQPSAGHGAWTGVWKSDTAPVTPATTASYNPATPNQREFVRWLVSSNRSSLNDVAAAAATDDHLIFEGDEDETSVKVSKVAVTGSSGKPGSYAYWVSDEAVKADLAWNEGEFDSGQRKQAARLSATPGPDYEVFGGPLENLATYPISKDAGNSWLDDMEKVVSTADMHLVANAPADSLWLRTKRHDITFGSLGVMADVKLGGLRRDLSLAFEMDGTAEAEDATKFNQQTGEFVAGSDRFAAPVASPGMGNLTARHIYRDKQGSGSTFSGDIVTPSGTVRGPTWWALRDFANLYKRLTSSGDGYSLPARAYFPNLSGGAEDMTNLFPASASGAVWDQETTSKGYIYRPARANYAPVYLGMTCLIGVKVIDSKLAVSLDPIFHFWNPYNVDLRVGSLGVTMPKYAFPGRVTLWTKAGPNEKKKSYNLFEFINDDSTIRTETAFLLQDPGGAITMKPGEVMVFSPTPVSFSSPEKVSGTAVPGYFPSGFNNTGIIVSNFSGAGQVELDPDDLVGFVYTKGESGGAVSEASGSNRIEVHTSLPTVSSASSLFANPGDNIQGYQLSLARSTTGYTEYESSLADVSTADARSVTSAGASNATVPASNLAVKRFFGLFSILAKPAHYTASPPDGTTFPSNPVEVFSRFNPLYLTTNEETQHAIPPNHLFNLVTSGNSNDLLNNYGMNLSTQPRNAFWGGSFGSATGSTSVPMLGIPASPLHSLASFSNANLSVMAGEPMRAVGNSWSSPYFEPTSPYGQAWFKHDNQGNNQATAGDISWLANDALFDRYYLSGLAPEFTINGGGYSASGDISETLEKFFSSNPATANANPLLRPHLPVGKSNTDAIADLAAEDGYKKTGAYSLISGQFNVNSTSIEAWSALLRANRNFAVTYAQGSASDSSNGSPFPNSDRPGNPNPSSPLATQPEWAGFSRLSDAQITDLATKIVDQVKLRGPFMSLSDFVNHRVGPIDSSTSYTGAIQAALDLAKSSSGINSGAHSAAGSTTPDYSSGYFQGNPPDSDTTTSGIPGSITQADVLRPIAPRLSARSDTFRIRAYGETLDKDGITVLAHATCEAVVQRLPEYVDASLNEPWDEENSSSGTSLEPVNLQYGRRFSIVGFRWLNPEEI